MGGVAGRPHRLRRLLARLSVMVIALAFALLAVELVLPTPVALRGAIWWQCRGSIEEHEPGRLRPRADYVGKQSIGGGEQHIAHNSLGMRGPEFAAKRADERRVLFVGDSVTYGTGVEVEQTFAMQLAARLSQVEGRTVTCGLSACPGFGVRDHRDLIARVHDQFAPDLIVSCVFVENDLFDDLQLERGVFAGYPIFQAPHVRALRRSWRWRLSLYSNTAYVLEQLLIKHAPALALDVGATALSMQEQAAWDGIPADQSMLFLEQERSTPALERLLGATKAHLAAARAAAQGTPLVVVLVPSFRQYWPGAFAALSAQRPAEQPHRCGAIQSRLGAACRELELPWFDLLPGLTARSDVAELLIANDFHFTPRGHAVVAELLTAWLAERL